MRRFFWHCAFGQKKFALGARKRLLRSHRFQFNLTWVLPGTRRRALPRQAHRAGTELADDMLLADDMRGKREADP